MTRARLVTEGVVSYDPIEGLQLKAPLCPMYLDIGSDERCGKPATAQIVYYGDHSEPYWVEWWCPEHAAVFLEDQER